MEIDLTTPALLFSAISLIMLAYTNRFLSYAQLVRTLKEQYMENPSSVKAAQIANRMNDYSCRILLRRQNVTVNAKSLMGVLSAGLSDGQAVTIVAEGEDEAQAVCELSRMLGA